MVTKENILSIVNDSLEEGVLLFVEDNRLGIKTRGKQVPKALLEKIKTNKEAIISFLENDVKEINRVSKTTPTIKKRAGRQDEIPLSFSQERLWFLDKFEGTTNYHLSAVLQVTGNLNTELLSSCFKHIVYRHESLRTVFLEKDGIGYQKLLNTTDFQVEKLIAHNTTEEARKTLISNEVSRAFDLSKDYMLRVKILEASEDVHTLIVVVHHIAADGWSIPILINELEELYNSELSGKPTALPKLPIQYADYSIWQREHLLGETLEKRLSYWEDQLQGVETLELPIDFNRPANQSNKGASHKFKLHAETTQQLKAMAQKEGTTLFMLLLSLYKSLLHLYTNQEDICVGVPVANRSESAISRLIGFFVNTLALRSTITSSTPFAELLTEVKQTVIDGYNHQDIPFEKVVDRVVKVRDQSQSPLIQTLFSLQSNDQGSSLRLGEANIEFEEIASQTSKFDLSLDIIDISEELQISFDYCTDLFKEETISRMEGHFRVLIASVLEDATQPIGRLSILTPAEEVQLLETFNPVPKQPTKGTIVDFFRQQAESTPEATAVVYRDNKLTYKELNEQSEAIALHLQPLGVKTGEVIPICLNTSTDMIVSILGVLKSGAAYVPIDAQLPEERIRFILEDISPSILITERNDIDSEIVPAHISTLYVTDIKNRDKKALDNLIQVEGNAHLAYIIYTSGTTGKPKGVKITHVSLVDRAISFKEDYGVNESTRILQLANFSFDVFVSNLCKALLFGGQLILCDPEDFEPESLCRLIEKFGVTIIESTPGIILPVTSQILEENISVPTLKTLIIGSDAWNLEDYRKLVQSFRGNVRIINSYGTTETTIDATIFEEYDSEKLDQYLTLPVGHPIRNTSIYVLNDYLGLVPVGIVGELCIGGNGVGEGYLNRESLTEEKFIINPYGEGMLYRTGDLARWTSDGVLEFLGRKDRQVKVRGYRIEPGEVERSITEATGIEQVLVMARKVSGSLQLVSYLVTDKEIDTATIMNALEGILPGYMIPRFYIGLEALPLTRNGKVDYKSLPSIEFDISEDLVAPCNETERELVEIWSSVLQIDAEKIGTTHNFFELGGDSIKAIQLVSRAKTRGIHLKVRDVFEHQTISKLSANLPTEELAQSEQGMLNGELGLLPIQRDFFSGDQPHPDHYNQSVLLELDASVSSELLADSLSLLVEQHDALRIGYERSGETVKARYTDQRATLIEERIGSLSDIATRGEHHQSQLDITTGEVCRFVLFEGEGLAPHLLMVIHHLSVDGVSWRILLEDLESLLRQGQDGKAMSLPSKGSSYRQWQRCLEQYASSTELLDEHEHWKDILDSHEAFPTDHDHNEESTLTDIEEIESTIDNETTRALLQDIHHSYGTGIDDILLSALSKALCDHSGRDQVVISLEGHGREDLFDGMDITRTVGWFTTVYPVMLENRAELSDLIADTKDRLRSIPNKGMGFGVLRHLSDVGGLDADFSDIVFNYLGDFDNSLDVSDEALLTFSSLDKGSDIHKLNHTPHKLEINAMLVSGELRFTWSYDSNRYSKETINKIASGYTSILKSIIEHCTAIDDTIKTPSDYGLPLTVDHASLQAFKNLSSHAGAITDISVLSPLQEGMLFHSLYENNDATYVSRFTCDFIGGFDIDIFRKSWEHITNKHSILRTGIYADNLAIPVQCVYDQISLKIEEVDYRNVDQKVLTEKLNTFISKEEMQGFAMEEAPLFSFSLIHLPDDHTKLLMKNHHILWDGWSLSVLMGEFINCYEQLAEKDSLPVLSEDNYGTFIRDIKSKSKGTMANFWKEYLLDISHPVYLPFFKQEHLRNKTFADRSSNLDLGAVLTTQLKEYAAKHHLTLNTMVQGAWSYLLSRYTGEETVVFGATVSGRDSELENIENGVGLYINTIPVCSNISKDDTIADWLDELQKGHTTAREEYSHISLNEIQGYIDIQTTPFDTLLVFENYPVDEALLSNSRNLSIANIDGHEYTNYVLTLGVGLFGESISIKFDHNEELFSSQRIEMIKEHFKELLTSLVSGVSHIKELNYMTPGERLQLLEAFNPSLDTPREPDTIVNVFKAQTGTTPEAIAATFGNTRLTYRELDLASDRVAFYLQAQDYGPESKIVLHMERSLEMLIGILGIMKSGHVYVPVDVSHPKERLDYIIEDSSCVAILVSGPSEVVVPKTHYIGEILNGEDTTTPALEAVSPESTAYIIYTSGTTGKPKGVMVSHQSLHSFTSGFEGMFTRGGRQPVMASNAFDIFLFELFNPLLSGGTAMLLGDEVVRDPELLLEVLRNSESFHAVPSLMTELVATIREEGKEDIYRHIKELYVGGDRVPNTLLMSMREVFPDATIHVFYGPTESTVVVSCMTYEKEDIIPESGNYIGRPTHENQIVLLDASNALTPIGVTGELCVSGPQVSMGYLNREALTKEKFIINPDGEGRLYRTGDLARWTSDGVLEFLGRKDRQVKVRGYRIEPGEVERSIAEATGIEQVLVMAREISGSLQLVSYLVTDKELDSSEIIQSLEGTLPGYMVPRFYIGLKVLPLTRNGKVDYKFLPDVAIDKTNDLVLPSNPTEETLLKIWSSVLDIEQEKISTTHNFFEIGGDSIKAMRLFTKINSTFDTTINLTDLFEHPTISSFHSYIELLTVSVDESDYEEYTL